MATTHQPETLTELYFTNYQTIPKKAQPGKQYQISFTAVNHEGSQTKYPYRVLLVSDEGIQHVQEGSLTLDNMQAKVTTVPVVFDRPSVTYQVVIQFPSINQKINVRIST